MWTRVIGVCLNPARDLRHLLLFTEGLGIQQDQTESQARGPGDKILSCQRQTGNFANYNVHQNFGQRKLLSRHRDLDRIHAPLCLQDKIEHPVECLHTTTYRVRQSSHASLLNHAFVWKSNKITT